MERPITVNHVSLEIPVDFDRFTTALEQLLGRFDPALLKDVTTDPKSVETRVKAASGEEDLMLFAVYDHGTLLGLHGSPRKARQYVLGNPLIAAGMTRHDVRAGLYAPLRLLVYATDPGSTQVEYDQPSSLFGQFGNAAVTAVAHRLDAKLAGLIAKAEKLAGADCRT